MFFPEKVTKLNPGDSVLEIGPGGAPFERADVYLEANFSSEEEYDLQAGHVKSAIKNSQINGKPVVYYDRKKFPFADKEFDYVVCSHVIEHVPDVQEWLGEVSRVSKRGYIEFPTVNYEYLYNIQEHLNLVHVSGDTILYMDKNDFPFQTFAPISLFFNTALGHNYSAMVRDLVPYMIEGIEWEGEVKSRRVTTLEELVPEYTTLRRWDGPKQDVPMKWLLQTLATKVLNKFKIVQK